MRKQYKKKKKSCALCKPHKTCGDCRWTSQEKDAIIRAEKMKKEYLGKIEKESDE